MIRSIRLVNWRSHENTELSFGKGTNIIVGIMGAGKSSVLEGICFGLFGTFPALQQKKLKLTDIITNRPAEKEEARVELDFDADGTTYTAVRAIGRKKGSGLAELRTGSKLIESGPERVNESVEKLLKLDYDLFTRAIFSEQNRIDYFLMLAPGERKKKIDELLGIDRFELARSNLRTVVNRFKTESAALKSAMTGANAEKLKADLSLLEKENEELKRRIAEGEKQMKTLESERQACDAALKKVGERRTAWLAFDRDRASFEGIAANLKRELAEAEKKKPEDRDKAYAELGKLKAELAERDKLSLELDAKKNELSSSLGAIKAKFDNLAELSKKNELLQKDLAALVGAGGTIESLRSEHLKSRQELDEFRKKLAEAEALHSSLTSAGRELEKAGAKCPVCEEPLEEAKKKELVAKRKREIEAAHALASSLKSEVASKSKVLDELERRLSRAIELQASISKLDEDELRRLKSEAEKLSGSIEALASEAKGARKKRTELEQSIRSFEEKVKLADDFTVKQASMKSMEKNLEEVARKLAKLDYTEAEYQKANADLLKCAGEMKALDANIGNWQVQFSKLMAQMSDLRARLAEMEKYSKKIENWERTVEDLEVLGNSIVEVQGSLRSELIEYINSAMNSVWVSLYPYGDYTKVRLSADEAGYELELGDGERWVLAEGVASGGERACASLALRIAFARVLASNLNWLILDEPTHNLDSEAIGALTVALRDSIPQIVDQLFVITHDEKLKEAASGRLYLLDRNKRANEPTSVELLS
ncbi:DNA double-strand break repair Rad50 ATPase [Candidatus Burarchaeum australiense]|nr:DNA double-strand break repair Rad50 ATPase [Candidatus Burarchaeum australiense]